MARQPLSTVVRLEEDAHYSIGQGPHLFDPAEECTRLIGCCLASWADVQVQLATLLSVLLKSYSDAAFAVFLALRTSRERRDVLQAAANVTLTGRDLDLFNAIIIALESVEKQRNDLAHGIFAYYPKLRDCILWIDPLDWAMYQVRSIKNAENKVSNPNELLEIKKKTYVYRPRDLAQIYEEILEIRTAVLSFFKFIRLRSPDVRYRQICSSPLIQQALLQIREGQKNKNKISSTTI